MHFSPRPSPCLKHIIHLSSAILALSIFLTSGASPLSLPIVFKSLTPPTNFTNPVHTIGNLSLGEWPDTPFAVKIRTTNPNEHCALSITNLGTRLGNGTESYHALLAIHDRIAVFKAQPKESTPAEFVIVVVDILLEMILQEDLDLELAIGALSVLEALVYNNHARNIRAIVSCNGVAYATMRIDFMNQNLGAGNGSLPVEVAVA